MHQALYTKAGNKPLTRTALLRLFMLGSDTRFDLLLNPASPVSHHMIMNVLSTILLSFELQALAQFFSV